MASLVSSRYALPPLRFVYDDVANAKKTADPSSISEDCLTINVYKPAGISPKEKLPVVSRTSPAFILLLSKEC